MLGLLASPTPTNLLIGESQRIKMIDSCEAYKFDTNYKQLQLRFYNLTNIAKVLITDKYFNDCSENSLVKCGVDSNICQSKKIILKFKGYDLSKKSAQNFDFEIDFSTKMCLSSVIVYMIKKEVKVVPKNNTIPNNNSSLLGNNTTIVHTNTSQFHVHSEYSKENCGYAHQSTFGYCAESSIQDCRNCNWKGCSLIQCGNEVKKQFVC